MALDRFGGQELLYQIKAFYSRTLLYMVSTINATWYDTVIHIHALAVIVAF